MICWTVYAIDNLFRCPGLCPHPLVRIVMCIPVTTNILQTCIQIRYFVYQKSQEFAGSISEDSFTCTKGQTDNVLADIKTPFSWHYHPGDRLDFSLTDWIVFVLSGSRKTALFTDSRVLLLSKDYPEDRCSALKEELRRICQQDSRYSALMFAKTIRILNRFFNCAFESDRLEEICRKAGFSFGYLKFKEGEGYVPDTGDE